MREYRERLYVPLAWWLLALPSALIIGATVYAGLPWPWPIIIVGGLLAGCAAMLVSLGRGSVEVGAGAVRAGGAALPLAAVREVVALDEQQTMRLRGPRADPAARLYSRPYLRESVYVAVDPAAPGAGVPYWLIGTRHPAQLAAAIERCRVHGGHEPVA
jgi:GNAT superfamily N-acetyltransferase